MNPILDALPKELHPFDAVALLETSASASSSTLTLVCDKASANMVILRQIAFFFLARVYTVVKNLLLLCDSCGVHLHHRAKLAVKRLKIHTCKHFSMAAIHRQSPIHNEVLFASERDLIRLVQRRVGRTAERFLAVR